MIALPHRGASHLVLAWLILGGGTAYGQTQTPGQITKFDPSLNVVDSVVTEDASGNIGIGTTTPAAALDVASGDLNLGGNILKNGVPFIGTVGFANTFLGNNAGNFMMTGCCNTSAGGSALSNNAGGVANAAFGYQALFSNTSGTNNTASGYETLTNNIDGSSNTAVGMEALTNNIGGNDNTAIGAEALTNNTSGFSNTAIGVAALSNNAGGPYNTAIGFFALGANQGGDSNTAIGVDALRLNTGGFGNTAIGHSSAHGNQSGTYNTAVGYLADVSASNLINATAIGFRAIVNANNKIRLGNTSVAVIEGQVPYTFVSDRNQKEHFQTVDGEDVLHKVGALSLTSWNYIGHDPAQFRHYGPVAQEFFAAFGHDGVGTVGTPTTINSGDLEGILMIAVQALEKRTAENADLRARVEELERLVKSVSRDPQ